MSSFKKKLRKAWNVLVLGHHEPGRVFVRNKKVYVLELNYSSLLFSSQSVLKFVLKGVSSILMQIPVIISILGGLGFITAGIIEGGSLPFILPGLMFVFLAPYIVVQIYSGGDDGSIPVLITGPHGAASEYAGKDATKISEILSHLTEDQVIEIVENLEKIDKIEDLIEETKDFLAKNPHSPLANDVKSQIDTLNAQLKKLVKSQNLEEAMKIYDKETAVIEDEKAMNLLQQVSKYTSEVDPSFSEASLELQNTGTPLFEEVEQESVNKFANKV